MPTIPGALTPTAAKSTNSVPSSDAGATRKQPSAGAITHGSSPTVPPLLTVLPRRPSPRMTTPGKLPASSQPRLASGRVDEKSLNWLQENGKTDGNVLSNDRQQLAADVLAYIKLELLELGNPNSQRHGREQYGKWVQWPGGQGGALVVNFRRGDDGLLHFLNAGVRNRETGERVDIARPESEREASVPKRKAGQGTPTCEPVHTDVQGAKKIRLNRPRYGAEYDSKMANVSSEHSGPGSFRSGSSQMPSLAEHMAYLKQRHGIIDSQTEDDPSQAGLGPDTSSAESYLRHLLDQDRQE